MKLKHWKKNGKGFDWVTDAGNTLVNVRPVDDIWKWEIPERIDFGYESTLGRVKYKVFSMLNRKYQQDLILQQTELAEEIIAISKTKINSVVEISPDCYVMCKPEFVDWTGYTVQYFVFSDNSVSLYSDEATEYTLTQWIARHLAFTY